MSVLPSRIATRLPAAIASSTANQTSRFASSRGIPLALQQPRRNAAAFSTRASPQLSVQASSPLSLSRKSARELNSSSSPAHIAPTNPGLLHRSTHTSTTSPTTPEPTIHSIFEPVTGTWQYIVADPVSLSAAIIDPVLDFAPGTTTITTDSADSLLSLIMFWGYTVTMILETHAHADHLTAASYLRSRLALQQGGQKPVVAIGKRIGQVQELFAKRYGVPEKEYTQVFDRLLGDDEGFEIGGLTATAMHLPGHTPDHMGYRIGNNVFCGDSLFHGDIGTARCDFPGGSSSSLYLSAQKLLSLPPSTKIWTGHDYPPEGRDKPIPYMTVAEHRERNVHVKEGISEDEFVRVRDARDGTLGAPRLLHQSLQINVRAGNIPGEKMMRVPVKVVGVEW